MMRMCVCTLCRAVDLYTLMLNQCVAPDAPLYHSVRRLAPAPPRPGAEDP